MDAPDAQPGNDSPDRVPDARDDREGSDAGTAPDAPRTPAIPRNPDAPPDPDAPRNPDAGGGEEVRVVSGAETVGLAHPRTVRKGPRFGRIGVLSGVIGVICCAVVTWLFARPTEFLSLPGVFLLLAVFLVPVFVFAGLAIALLMDARARRRSARN